VAVLTVDQNAVLHHKYKAMRDYGRPDLEVRREFSDLQQLDGSLARLTALQTVQRVAPVWMTSTQFTTESGRRQRLQWLRTPLDSIREFQTVSHKSGALFDQPDLDPEQALWTTARMAREHDLEVGDRVEVGGRWRVVAGLLDSLRMAAADEGEVVLTPWSAEEFQRSEEKSSLLLWVKLEDPNRRAETWAQLRAKDYLVQPPPYERISATAEDIAMRNGLKICAILSLFLGLFIVFHTLLMTVSERRTEISLLHALGATRRQIGVAFLAESLLQSILGAGGGVFLGVALAWLMGKVGISSMGATRFAIYEVPWTQAWWVGVGGILLTILGAIYPVFMTARVPTSQVLYPTGIPLENLRPNPLRWLLPLLFAAALGIVQFFMEWIIDPAAAHLVRAAMGMAALLTAAVSLVFVMPVVIQWTSQVFGKVVPLLGGRRYFLAYRNVSASSHRNTTAVCALMLVFGAIFCMHTLTESLKDEIRRWAATATGQRIFFRPRTAPRPVDREPFLAVDGIRTVLAVENEVHVPMLIRGMDLSPLLNHDLPSEDREALQRCIQGEGVIVTRAFAQQCGVTVDSELSLPTRTSQTRYPVLLISDRYGYQRPERAYALMAPQEVTRAFGARSGYAMSYILHHEPGRDAEALKQKMRPLWKDRQAYVSTGQYLFQNRVRNIDLDFLVFDVVLLGAVVLAGISMLNSLSIRAMERRREVALYRALGMTQPQLIDGLTAEGMILGITGGVLALFLGVPCSYLAHEALREVSGLDLIYGVPWFWALICLLLCTLVAYLASRQPARYLSREDIATSLQYS
jgi:putative ABC transport system permease protein